MYCLSACEVKNTSSLFEALTNCKRIVFSISQYLLPFQRCSSFVLKLMASSGHGIKNISGTSQNQEHLWQEWVGLIETWQQSFALKRKLRYKKGPLPGH